MPARLQRQGGLDVQAPGSEPSRDDIAVARRELRIRLLRDLVSNGLYRVPTDALADRLVTVVIPRA